MTEQKLTYCLMCRVSTVELRCQGFLRLVGTSGGAQERKFAGGSMQLPDRMAAELDPGRVRFSSPVVAVKQSSDGTGKTTVVTSDGANFTADYVISAVPLSLLNRIQFQPTLPPLKLQLIQRLPMGSIIKTMTFYEQPFWRSNGYSGQLLVDDDAGLRVWSFDDTKPDGQAPCLLGFISGNHVSVFECSLRLFHEWLRSACTYREFVILYAA
jgi:monoamine oxidase